MAAPPSCLTQGAACAAYTTRGVSPAAKRRCPGLSAFPAHTSRRSTCTRRRLAAEPATQETAEELEVEHDRQATPAKRKGGLARQILSQAHLEGEPLKFLKHMEAYWTAQRTQRPRPPPHVVRTRGHRLSGPLEHDVIVAGGTLGILPALALQLRGHNVCVIERRRVEGRAQEWNASREELQVLLQLGLTTPSELEDAIATEFHDSRISFHGGFEMWLQNVLNLGILPRTLLGRMRERFLQAGGTIREHTTVQGAEVCSDGIAVRVSTSTDAEPISVSDTNRPLATYSQAEASSPAARSSSNGNGRSRPHAASNGAAQDRRAAERPANGAGRQSTAGQQPSASSEVRGRLLLDCMGHWSPIVKQMRGMQQPDGMCLVVGGCASGFTPENNKRGDFLRTITDAENDMQLMWQAFPANGGRDRTTYMFAYADNARQRPSLEAMLDRYFELLPHVCGMPLAYLNFRRMLFAGLPSYASSPLRPKFDRILQVGDASSASSPISFGGFGAMLRHLERLTDGIDQALMQDRLSRQSLALLQPYQPSLSSSWLFQRAMSMRIGQQKQSLGRSRDSPSRGWLPANHVNELLTSNFRVMRVLGEGIVKRSVQDTCQWGPLSLTMAGMFFTNPLLIARVMCQVGPQTLLGWFRHYFSLMAYALLARIGPVLKLVPKLGQSFWLARMLEAWTYGAGLDWGKHKGAAQHAEHGPDGAMPSLQGA